MSFPHSIARGPKTTLAISGETPPRPMFDYMAEARFDWSGVHMFSVDERALAAETLIGPAKIPDANVHRMEAELPPERGGDAAFAAQALAREGRSSAWFFDTDAAKLIAT